jgi:hypothetical protein
MGDKPFCEIFPRLFRLSALHNVSIHSLASANTIPVDWNFGFRRNLNDEEALEVSGLLGLIERVVLQESKKDTRSWNLEASGAFTCKSFRNFLCNENPYPNFDPAKFIWESKVPPKVKFLGWLVAHGRLNTCEMLQRRRPNSCFSPHWCVLCKQHGESAIHIFLQCDLASHLWQKLYWEAGLTWDAPSQISDLLTQTQNNQYGFGRGKKARVLWGCSVLAIFWVLWMERNRRIFEGYGGVGFEFLWGRIRFWVALWASVSEAFKDYSFSTILRDWRAAAV